MRAVISLMLALMLTMTAAAAEPAMTPLPTAVPRPQEEVEAVVAALFGAIAGTDAESEQMARKDLTEEEILLRNADRALYRAQTLPWLAEAIRPEEEATTGETCAVGINSVSPAPTPLPTPGQAPLSKPSFTPSDMSTPAPTPVIWTVEDSYAAMSENEWGKAYLELLRSMGAEDREACMELTREICAQWMAEVDHEKLEKINEDYACWIFAPNTQIDYPIAHGKDNSYYLNRMLNREKNSAGTLFMDYRNLPDFQDPNTLIYGHHMRNDSMFGTLTDYLDQAYFEANPYMILMSPKEIAVLELFAGYTTSEKDHCYDIAITDEEDMRIFLDEAMRKTEFISGVQVQTFDRLVTLSTCAYAFENARYILLGRIVSVWNEPIDWEELSDCAEMQE